MSTFDAGFMGPLDQGDTYSSWSFTDTINQGTKTIVDLIGAKATIDSALKGASVTPVQERQDAAATRNNNTLLLIGAAVLIYLVLK